MYFSMNFLWNSDRKASLMYPLVPRDSPFAQFLNTTSSSHLQTYVHTETMTLIPTTQVSKVLAKTFRDKIVFMLT